MPNIGLRRKALIAMAAAVCMCCRPTAAAEFWGSNYVSYWVDPPYAIGCDMDDVEGAEIFAGVRNDLRSLVWGDSRIKSWCGPTYITNVDSFGHNEDLIYGVTHAEEYFILVKESGELIAGFSDRDEWARTLRERGEPFPGIITFWDGFCNEVFCRGLKALLCVAILLLALVGVRRLSRRYRSAKPLRMPKVVDRVRKASMLVCIVLSALAVVFVALNWIAPQRAFLALLASVLWFACLPWACSFVRVSRKWILLIPVAIGGLGYAVATGRMWGFLVRNIVVGYFS